MSPARTKLDGHYPQNKNELMVTKDILKACGSENLSVGDRLVLTYENNTGAHTDEFVISGIWDGYGDTSAGFVSKAFYDETGYDLKNDGIKVHRKGGKEVIVYFGDEVELALLDYLEQRNQIVAQEGEEHALFLSLQRRRIGVRAVENLVKKYSRAVTTMKNITPHKLRSTYGTNLYRETGDIYLVADVLGHADVNTTKKHYAAIDDDRRKQARNIVKLRKTLSDGGKTSASTGGE